MVACEVSVMASLDDTDPEVASLHYAERRDRGHPVDFPVLDPDELECGEDDIFCLLPRSLEQQHSALSDGPDLHQGMLRDCECGRHTVGFLCDCS